MKKRFTYSKKDKARSHKNEDRSTPEDEDGSRKRRKTDSPSETSSFVSVPTISSTASSIRAKSSALFKRGSQMFSGPASITPDDAEVDVTPRARKSLSSLFDKAIQGGRTAQLQTSQQPKIHGSREEFVRTVEVRKREPKSTQTSGSYLPTPPSEVQRLRSNGTGSSNSSGLGALTKSSMTSATYDGSSETTDLSREPSKSKTQKQPYVPKIYAARRTPHPGADLYGDPLPKRSQELQLWSTNQSKSPFLRLPEEVRARIYAYILGGRTITIGYETYRRVEAVDEAAKAVPIFRYCCAIYSQRNVNPFGNQPPFVNVMYKYTPLNNICRQLYHETATLPFMLNTLAFSTHNVMFNFLYLEQRLSREQRDAITSITLQNALPMANFLVYMRKLQKVVLVDGFADNQKGTYKVTRVKGKAPKLLNTRHVWGG
ncbi:uncharacterized protein M421DRAFT_503 [Didymella exigua CBS 183.55]|uniref:DUF7730 domain-containing protein n=1 Tax=Didymella exigua CBS 183.55 TaxID=1150837 RepID=A0A6A5S4J5_9PLEO|nr:uncharacterized protein M421DRAFT_503 [Didymella exigua CBS 183.55]KAF1934374.1 hypothetical protein M421DRAFT_503 [Didymella exigua CBS 183.55]